MPKLMIILASTRPGRAGEAIARWFAETADAHGGFEVELVDLAEVGLPLFDEPRHPRLREYTQPHTMRWSALVESADAFVFVHPEYNHSYNAALKNAIDFLHHEWAHKPVGFVSYGGVAAGTRALQHLKPVVSVLKMVPVAEAVNLPFFTQFIDEHGEVRPNETMLAAADVMLDEIERLERVLRALRQEAVA